MSVSIVPGSVHVDAAGYTRVTVQNDANPSDTMMLKFPPGMSNQQMKDQGQIAVDQEIARRQAVAARQALLEQITNGVGLYQQGRLNATQQTNLLTALAAEWKGV